MIIIPEIETVVILVPRTGSGSLRRAVTDYYPKSFMVYRHMEADGVPHGYDRWRRIGVCREPTERLWSLYKFLKYMPLVGGMGGWEAQQRNSVNRSFSEYIIRNKVPFSDSYDSSGDRYYPQYTVLHAMPENRKSQFVYLRPDLGTQVVPYKTYGSAILDALEIRSTPGAKLLRENLTMGEPTPPLSVEAKAHMLKYFAWDFAFLRSLTGEQLG